MTTEQLQEVEAREQAAIEGPWKDDPEREDIYHRMHDGTHFGQVLKMGDHGRPVDLNFAAHARQDVPALIAHIHELEAANTWRDVEEELPVADTDVLVCTDRGAVWVARLSESGIWWQDRYALDVTYWRPLPTPPQEKADG